MAEELADNLNGELFADTDPRTEGRVVRVVSTTSRFRRGTTQRCYVVEVVEHPISSTIGRRSTVSRDLLKKHYRKVSH